MSLGVVFKVELGDGAVLGEEGFDPLLDHGLGEFSADATDEHLALAELVLVLVGGDGV